MTTNDQAKIIAYCQDNGLYWHRIGSNMEIERPVADGDRQWFNRYIVTDYDHMVHTIQTFTSNEAN